MDWQSFFVALVVAVLVNGVLVLLGWTWLKMIFARQRREIDNAHPVFNAQEEARGESSLARRVVSISSAPKTHVAPHPAIYTSYDSEKYGGPDPLTTNVDRLHWAIEKGKFNEVVTLLDGGADVNAAGIVLLGAADCEYHIEKITPLSRAARRGDVGIVTYLLAKGAFVQTVEEGRLTPLHFAAGGYQNGADCARIVELLIHAGARVNAKSDDGETPLHRAVRKGDPETIEMLLRHGALPNDYARSCGTPMSIANHNIGLGHGEPALRCVALLRRYGAA